MPVVGVDGTPVPAATLGLLDYEVAGVTRQSPYASSTRRTAVALAVLDRLLLEQAEVTGLQVSASRVDAYLRQGAKLYAQDRSALRAAGVRVASLAIMKQQLDSPAERAAARDQLLVQGERMQVLQEMHASAVDAVPALVAWLDNIMGQHQIEIEGLGPFSVPQQLLSAWQTRLVRLEAFGAQP